MKFKYLWVFLMVTFFAFDGVIASHPASSGSVVLNNTQEAFIRSRIDYLDKITPIKLEFNSTINSYINLYLYKKPQSLAVIVGRKERYFPLFEEMLAKYNLPLELKYLPVIESALDPFAVSKSGAVGLWQFLFHTSRMFDIKIDSYVDERRDPVKSTEAACKYLQYLFRMFNDWQLAITAYNCGPGLIEKAIAQSGGQTNYWSLRPYLTNEAKGYYPTFVAAAYVVSFYQEHDIIPLKDQLSFYEIAPVTIRKSIYFKQVSDVLGIDQKILKELNPSYSTGYIPVKSEGVELMIPKKYLKLFYTTEELIYSCDVENKNYLDLKAEIGNKTFAKKIIHTVKKGEFFHTVAMNYGCTIGEIMMWNGMRDKRLFAGQSLVIYQDMNESVALNNRLKRMYPVYTTYTIRKGDTLHEIAKMFPKNSEGIIKYVNNLNDNNVEPGQQIKIINF